jgi:hypothetical protein
MVIKTDGYFKQLILRAALRSFGDSRPNPIHLTGQPIALEFGYFDHPDKIPDHPQTSADCYLLLHTNNYR